MADLLKLVTKLVVAADGRTADNWTSYKVQLENALSGKEVGGLYLDDVLLGKGPGIEPADPGSDVAAWIAGRSNRTDADYALAVTARSTWARANRVAHGYVMGSLPEDLHEECAQRLNAAQLWAYLEQRFSAQGLTSVAALWVRLFQLRLDDYGGVSAYLTALTKLELELQRAGRQVEPTLLAGAILIAMGDRYPTTRELLMTLPVAEQTKATFGLRLLEAEKNAKVTADLSAMTFGGGGGSNQGSSATAGAATTKNTPCKYVRKHQGKLPGQAAGTQCGRRHNKGIQCWARMDDQWMSANPTKTGADLPNWRDSGTQQQGSQGGAGAGQKSAQANVTVLTVSGTNPVSEESYEDGSFLGYLCALKETQEGMQELCEVEVTASHVTVALDSGATASCFRQGTSFKPLAEPVTVRGALPGLTSLAKGTTAIPCPALPSGTLRGLHSPDFRHNLVSVSELQSQGVEVVFPAGTRSAHCKDPSTGKVLWSFRQGQLGLYEAKVREHTAASAVGTPHPSLHPTTLLHRRLGHLGEASLRTLIRHQAITGLPEAYIAPPVPFTTSCVPCIQGKTQAKPHPLVRARAAKTLERVHVDLVGPLPQGVKGHRFWLTIVDDYSRYGWSIPLHTKDQAKHRLIEWVAMAERQTGCKLKEVRADRGGEFVNDTLLGHFRAQGVRTTFSNPHSPEQNGVAEARNKQVGRFTRLLLLNSQAPLSYWPYAVKHATVLNNLVPHGLLQGSTPYGAWFKIKPNMRRLRVWGCTGHVLLNQEEKRRAGGKLGPVTKACALVGINPQGPGWLLWDPTTRKEIHSSDVVFQEQVPYFNQSSHPHSPFEWAHFEDSDLSTVKVAPAPAPAQASAPPSSTEGGHQPGTPPEDQEEGHHQSEGGLSKGPEDRGAVRGESAGGGEDSDTESQNQLGTRVALAPRGSHPARPRFSGQEPADEGHGSSQPRGQGEPGLEQVQLEEPPRRSTRDRCAPTPYWIVGNAPALPARGIGARGAGGAAPQEGAEQSPEVGELRRSLRLQSLPPVHTETLVALPGSDSIPKQAVVLLQEVVHGESGSKRKEIPTPADWQEALNGEHPGEWLESMVKEVTGLQATGTYQEVPRDRAKNILKCKWLFKVKRRPDGTPIFKSRLVVKGCSQKQGVDYFETYAPTAKQVTGRLLLHLAATQGFHIQVMDVDQAFCHGDLEEEIYMEAPPGLTGRVQEGTVWLLKRPLYGLKQAPRQWHAKLKEVLYKLGFKPSQSDPSLFMYQGSNGFWVLVYVDDMLLLSKSEELLNQFKDQLRQHFPMKDLGDIGQYLGMEITRDWGKQEVYLSQHRYIQQLLQKFGYEEGKEYNTPLQVNHSLTKAQEGGEQHPEQDRFPELLGGVMYLMVCTRPDIAHAVSVLSRFVAPGRHGGEHWKAGLRLLGYLKATSHYQLALGGSSTVLTGYSDSSWADDQADRRSSQGHCFQVGAGTVSWKACRSPAVALSTCEAELYAACSAAQEAVWLSDLLAVLGYPQSPAPMLWCDNESTVALTKDAMFSGRSKHIEARYYFIRELVQAQKLRTAHIPGVENPADIFTKPLSVEDHSRLREMLGVRSITAK